jgi:hypothetical protein
MNEPNHGHISLGNILFGPVCNQLILGAGCPNCTNKYDENKMFKIVFHGCKLED